MAPVVTYLRKLIALLLVPPLRLSAASKEEQNKMAAPLVAASQPELMLGISSFIFGSFLEAPKWLQPLVVYAAFYFVALRLKAFI